MKSKTIWYVFAALAMLLLLGYAAYVAATMNRGLCPPANPHCDSAPPPAP